MVIVFLEIVFGIGSFVGGIASGIAGLKQAENNELPWLIGATFLLFGFGGYLLYRASTHREKMNFEEDRDVAGKPAENILMKNNQLLSEFIKESEKEDKNEGA